MAPSGPTADEALETLRDYVAKHGLKFTRQRELISEVFFKSGGHLKVEDLLERVREVDPQVSLATVYRTMKLLTECGLAEPHRFGDGHTRYEPTEGDDEHHDHIICSDCGRIVEFFNAQLEQLQEEIARSHGFRLKSHRMELYGTCQLGEDCPHLAAGKT
ncbi:MAG TPA: transcriptional repressor [Myxococcales bacterium LLY-WYZ-16_1]|jgi:Fur family ferric uptake transcriptional regulator|nr:transcriptional repressor [Myxococcales bacterium LLY-WYZ-16_1]